MFGPLIHRGGPAVRHQHQVGRQLFDPFRDLVSEGVGADYQADAPERCFNHSDILRPAFGVGWRHQPGKHVELAVLPEDLAGLVHQDGGVIELVAVFFIDADGDHQPIFPGKGGEAVAVGARARRGHAVGVRISPPQDADSGNAAISAWAARASSRAYSTRRKLPSRSPSMDRIWQTATRTVRDCAGRAPSNTMIVTANLICFPRCY